VTESCEASLRELGMDHVNLMQLHLYWPTWGHHGYWMDEMQALRQSGVSWVRRRPPGRATTQGGFQKSA